VHSESARVSGRTPSRWCCSTAPSSYFASGTNQTLR
jgi:hypothetical protein